MLSACIVQGVATASTVGLQGQVGRGARERSVHEDGATTTATTRAIRRTTEDTGFAIGSIGGDRAGTRDVAHVHDHQSATYATAHTGGGIVRITATTATA